MFINPAAPTDSSKRRRPIFVHGDAPRKKVTLWVQTEWRGHLLDARSVSLWSMRVTKLLKSLSA